MLGVLGGFQSVRGLGVWGFRGFRVLGVLGFRGLGFRESRLLFCMLCQKTHASDACKQWNGFAQV